MVLHGTRVDTAPGIVLYRMTRAHDDAGGTTWPTGTEYTPLSAGRDNVRGCDLQTVVIAGLTVQFESHAKDPAAVSLGRKGGLRGGPSRSSKKASAARVNGLARTVLVESRHHSTAVRLRPLQIEDYTEHDGEPLRRIRLSPGQVRRAHRDLCGDRRCACRGWAGVSERQTYAGEALSGDLDGGWFVVRPAEEEP